MYTCGYGLMVLNPLFLSLSLSIYIWPHRFESMVLVPWFQAHGFLYFFRNYIYICNWAKRLILQSGRVMCNSFRAQLIVDKYLNVNLYVGSNNVHLWLWAHGFESMVLVPWFQAHGFLYFLETIYIYIYGLTILNPWFQAHGFLYFFRNFIYIYVIEARGSFYNQVGGCVIPYVLNL